MEAKDLTFTKDDEYMICSVTEPVEIFCGLVLGKGGNAPLQLSFLEEKRGGAKMSPEEAMPIFKKYLKWVQTNKKLNEKASAKQPVTVKFASMYLDINLDPSITVLCECADGKCLRVETYDKSITNLGNETL